MNIIKNNERESVPTTSEAMLEKIYTILEDKKAQDIVTINLIGKTAIADYMIIATGQSGRQITAIAEHLAMTLKKMGQPVGIEGLAAAEWVLVDAGDVIIHLFRPEIRALYNLEKMWGVDYAATDTIVYT
jgi:ribosome-associated protein